MKASCETGSRSEVSAERKRTRKWKRKGSADGAKDISRVAKQLVSGARRKNQAKKSAGWMPGRHTPKKDAASCEKPRGAASEHRSEDIRMGEPRQCNDCLPLHESIVQEEGTRGTETSKYPEEEKTKRDFPSSGERTGKRPNQRACFLGLWINISYSSH